jgi:glyoxylate/hydroxypyruvate reductase
MISSQKDILLVKSGDESAIPEWRRIFADLCPDLDVRWWDDPDADPAAVTFVLVWQPQPGRLAQLPNLRIIFSSGAGVDHITSDPTLPPHVPIVRMASAETLQTMGEYVCLAVLALQRDLKRALNAQAERRWDEFQGSRTAPQTRVGIMGLGNIGQTATRMLDALGYKLAGWSLNPKSLEHVACFAGLEQLDPFLHGIDILVGLLPETSLTRGLLSASRLALLPKGAGLVNAGRGSLVAMPDLIAALDSGHLSGAVLDVFEPEPPSAADPVWRHPRIIVTGHIAGFASRRARAEHVVRAIAAYRRGEPLPSLYQPNRGY